MSEKNIIAEMENHDYLYVKNWWKYQSYVTSPKWIKLHRSILSDPDFDSLSEIEQWRLVKLWLYASEIDGRLPADHEKIGRRLGVYHRRSCRDLLAIFTAKGFISQQDVRTDKNREETDKNRVLAHNKKRSSLIEPQKLAFEGKNLKITARQDSVFRAAFPWVDIPAEYRKMEAWIEANPSRKPKNCGRFAQNWLVRCEKPSSESSRKIVTIRDDDGDGWIKRPPGPPCEANGWKRADLGIVGKGRPPLVERDENGVEWYIA